MPVERSAGAVIFRDAGNTTEYLLLQHPNVLNKRLVRPMHGHWDFAKGHLESGEKTEMTVRREVKEETSLEDIELILGFKETIQYFLNFEGNRRLKFVAFFLARAPRDGQVKISWEHQNFVWLPYEEASARLTYPNAKHILAKAHRFLLRKGLAHGAVYPSRKSGHLSGRRRGHRQPPRFARRRQRAQ